MIDLIQGFKWKLSKNANVARSDFATSRWKVDRVAIELGKGLHGTQISQICGKELIRHCTESFVKPSPDWPAVWEGTCQLDVASADFDESQPAIFISFGSDLGKAILSPFEAAKDLIVEKNQIAR